VRHRLSRDQFFGGHTVESATGHCDRCNLTDLVGVPFENTNDVPVRTRKMDAVADQANGVEHRFSCGSAVLWVLQKASEGLVTVFATGEVNRHGAPYRGWVVVVRPPPKLHCPAHGRNRGKRTTIAHYDFRVNVCHPRIRLQAASNQEISARRPNPSPSPDLSVQGLLDRVSTLASPVYTQPPKTCRAIFKYPGDLDPRGFNLSGPS